MFDYSYIPKHDRDVGYVLHTETTDKTELQNLETLLCQGNGYLGIRGCFEEDYGFQTRGAFICGTYNKPAVNEVSELPNCADVVNTSIALNGYHFTLFEGTTESCSRTFYLRDGQLIRDVIWRAPDGNRYHLFFERFLSLDNLHLLASKISITPLDAPCTIEITAGIDGTVTNSGTQHFLEGSKRVHDMAMINTLFQTTQSGIDVNIVSAVLINGALGKGKYINRRRKLMGKYDVSANKGETVILERRSLYYTSVDKDLPVQFDRELFGKSMLEPCISQSYDELLLKSRAKWDIYWDDASVLVDGLLASDTAIVHAAQYHMRAMTAFHDDRVSICAKGLTGEGYKGHIFWSTELLMLPYFVFTNPAVAKNLLKYRYFRLDAARKNAALNAYLGAQFPWESADSGNEETPEFSAINIHTGKPTLILNGKKEAHITADIAFAVYQYYLATGDLGFMLDYGCEMVIECAIYWSSRCVMTNRGYEIQDVIGPDEYTESIDNNTYTNIMVKENLRNALQCAELLKNSERRYRELEDKIGFEYQLPIFKDILERLFLAYIEKDIIPQDDTFLSKPDLDIHQYKEQAGAQTILFDYTREQVVDMQVLKQADIVMLFYLLPAMYPKKIKIRNLAYYEKRTIHDSSFSKCIHAVVAIDCNLKQMADQFCSDAMHVDFATHPASGDGLHAASIFGILTIFLRGMCGVCIDPAGRLLLKSNLIKDIKSIHTKIWYQGRKIGLHVTKEKMIPRLLEGNAVEVFVYENGQYQSMLLMEENDEA